MPDGVPAEVAALIGCGVATGVGAVLRTAEVPAGSTVAVIGLGGVGLSCVMGAVLAGARRIVAVDVSRAKIDLAGSLGATHWVESDPDTPLRTVDAIRGAAGDGGPDFVFEAIGLPATIEQAIASTARAARQSWWASPARARRRPSSPTRSWTAGGGCWAPTTARRSPRSTSRSTRRRSWPAGCQSTASSTGGCARGPRGRVRPAARRRGGAPGGGVRG